MSSSTDTSYTIQLQRYIERALPKILVSLKDLPGGIVATSMNSLQSAVQSRATKVFSLLNAYVEDLVSKFPVKSSYNVRQQSLAFIVDIEEALWNYISPRETSNRILAAAMRPLSAAGTQIGTTVLQILSSTGKVLVSTWYQVSREIRAAVTHGMYFFGRQLLRLLSSLGRGVVTCLRYTVMLIACILGVAITTYFLLWALNRMPRLLRWAFNRTTLYLRRHEIERERLRQEHERDRAKQARMRERAERQAQEREQEAQKKQQEARKKEQQNAYQRSFLKWTEDAKKKWKQRMTWTEFPLPPGAAPTSSCQCFERQEFPICKHTVVDFLTWRFTVDRESKKKFLKDGLTLWHPDRFAPGSTVQQHASELFKILEQSRDELNKA